MARLPVPGSQLTGGSAPDRVGAIPAEVVGIVETLRSAGHAAYIVGGSIRDVFLGRAPADWDFATGALPDETLALFPGAVYENAFGTVAVRRGAETYEITTFRRDHDYADFRRPHRVEFGTTIEEDLARRDFTVNAIAWGGLGHGLGAKGGRGADRQPAGGLSLVDPFGGQADIDGRLLRTVGDPVARFREDALRMVRAVRFAATLDFAIEPAALAAIEANAELVKHLSGERIAAELEKLLAAPTPSAGLTPLEATGLLRWISPELGAQRGIPQNKVPGDDLWGHTLRTVDAARADRPVVRLTALVHDIGKPASFAEGRFHGHEIVGAALADDFLRQLHVPRTTTERIVHLVRNHMFVYSPAWTDAAVRRFIAKVGRPAMEELFELREADDVGSGLPAGVNGLDELRRRVATELAGEVVLDRTDLAIDGHDLIAELSLEPGPAIGTILERLLQAVIDDPALNQRPTLLLLAQSALAGAR